MSEEIDPRQLLFLEYYNNPKEDTFSNAYQSAIKAGYSEEYAKTIVSRDLEWVSEDVRRRKRILNKAEIRGELLIDSLDERVSADMVKHFTKTLGKNVGYSERQEVDHTTKGEKINAINYIIPNGNNDKTNGEATRSLPSPEEPGS